MSNFVTPDFNPGPGWAWAAASAVGTNDLLAGSCGFDGLHNRHKICPKKPSREMGRAYGTKREVGPFTPGLKSGVTKSVMPNGIFCVRDKGEFEYVMWYPKTGHLK